MQALEKIVINTDWITIFLVVLLAYIFLLKGLDSKRLKRLVFALFNKNLLEKEIEKNTSFFKVFNGVTFMFSMSVLSLISYYFLIYFLETKYNDFYLFGVSFLALFFYFLIKWALEYLLSVVFLVRNEVRFFLISKPIYLYTICFYLYIVLILVKYTKLNTLFLITITGLFFLTRFIFHLVNNKNLIFNKLFYFILYLCALEIAPLFILFKLMF